MTLTLKPSELPIVVRSAGGKRTMLPSLLPLVPEHVTRYYELFAGGAAMFFGLRAEHMLSTSRIRSWHLNDTDQALMRVYRAVQADPAALGKAAQEHLDKVIDPQSYRALRDAWNDGQPRGGDPALTYALRKVAWNGLWRVNRDGANNVPWCKTRRRVDADVLQAAHGAFTVGGADVTFSGLDFRHFTLEIQDPEHSFIFLDPPYLGGFTSYGQYPWREADLQALLRCAKFWADDLGATVVLTHSAKFPAGDIIRDIVPHAKVMHVSMKRSINSDGSGRGAVPELVVVLGGPRTQRTAPDPDGAVSASPAVTIG